MSSVYIPQTQLTSNDVEDWVKKNYTTTSQVNAQLATRVDNTTYQSDKTTINSNIASNTTSITGLNTQLNTSTTLSVGASSGTGSSNVCLGYQAGTGAAGSSVTVGYQAGINGQSNTVAVGYLAGNSAQRNGSIAVGYQAGKNSQGYQSVSLGLNAGNSNQGTGSIAIGAYAGQTSQPQNSIILNASTTALNGSNASAFYVNPIRTNNSSSNYVLTYDTTGKEVVADSSIYNTVSALSGSSIAVGSSASAVNSSIAIGSSAGGPTGNSAVSIGAGAGTFATYKSIYLGPNAGGGAQSNPSTNTQTIGIGDMAGNSNQSYRAIAIGTAAGQSAQGTGAVAFGETCGMWNQGQYTVAIGNSAGVTGQGSSSVAIGYGAGNINQSTNAVALGYQSGYSAQLSGGIAVGYQAGQTNQRNNAVAVGVLAGNNNQSTGSVAIGYHAGQTLQGQFAVAIGYNAGQTGQVANSICLNASGNIVNALNAGLYVNPVRNDTVNTTNLVGYNTSTNELTYSTSCTVTSDKGLYIGVGTPNLSYLLQLFGDAAAKPNTSTWTVSSDQRVKKNIEDADTQQCYDLIKNLKLRRFEWDPKYYPNVQDKNVLGYISQEVAQYYPKCITLEDKEFLISGDPKDPDNPPVYETIEGFMSLNTDQLFKNMHGAIAKLIEKVEALELQVAAQQ